MENWLDMYGKGGLIKRADGSYSRRGLWDNIRANRGSGRKPTAAMLEQERKIKKHEDGSFVKGEKPPIDPRTGKPAVLLPEVKIIGYKNPISYSTPGFSWKDVQQVNKVTNQKNKVDKQQEGLWAQRDNTKQQSNVKSITPYVPQMTPLQIADITTDIMQLGHLIPHPITQGIGYTGDFLGAGIDAYQVGQQVGQKKYKDAVANTIFGGLGLIPGSKSSKAITSGLELGYDSQYEEPQNKKADGGWINMYADGDVVTGENPPSKLQELAAQYQTIQDQVNKGNINKDAYVQNMRKIADDLIAKGFSLEEAGILPESVVNNPTNTGFCIGTSCYLADQAGDKFYPQGSSFFTSNSAAQDYAKSNPNASRYLEQSEKFITPGDILQFKSGEKGRPYHAYTVYDIGQANEDGDKIVTVVGSPGHGQMHKKTYILGKDNKIYSDEYGMKSMMHDTQLLKRREDNSEYNNLLAQRDALKQQILEVDPTYFTPKDDIRSGDYRQTGFMLNDQGQGNEYGKYVQTNNGKTNIQTPNPGTVNQAYNARPYIDASKSGLTDILAKYNDPQYKYDYMRKHNISNNEYDALVSNMVGIYGAESKFGTDYTAKGKLPEWPWLSKLANTVGFINEEERSIGPFQMTYNQLPEAYRKTIKSKDLYNPNIAADATMEYLTAGLPLLRKRANTTAETATERNPYSKNITKDNYLEYVPYLYNMRGWLKGDEATMEKKGDILRGDAGYKQLVDQYRNNVLQIIPTSLTTPQSIEVVPQQRNGGYVQKPCCNGMYNDGSWVANSSIPRPTTPSFYDAGADRTLTNYQMGTDKAPMYAAGSTVFTKQNSALWVNGGKEIGTQDKRYPSRNTRSLNPNRYTIGDVIPTGMDYKTPAAGTHDYNQDVQPYYTMRLHAPDTTKMGNGGHTPIGGLWDTNRKAFVDSTLQANTDKEWVKRLYNPNAGSIQIPGVPGRSTHYMSNADTRVYPSIQNINGKLTYLPGDQGWDYADETKSYINFNYPQQADWFASNGYKIGTNVLNNINQKGVPVNNPNYVIPKHKHGGHIKKHINSPRVYGSPVNPSGMSEGPSMQRGITFANGGWINNYENNTQKQANGGWIEQYN